MSKLKNIYLGSGSGAEGAEVLLNKYKGAKTYGFFTDKKSNDLENNGSFDLTEFKNKVTQNFYWN